MGLSLRGQMAGRWLCAACWLVLTPGVGAGFLVAKLSGGMPGPGTLEVVQTKTVSELEGPELG